jgi:uncharacterized protein YcfL
MKIFVITLLLALTGCSSAPVVKNIYYDKNGALVVEKCSLAINGITHEARLASCYTETVQKLNPTIN